MADLPRLSAHALTIGYRGAGPVLRGVELAVAEGEYLGLSGASGSGKTTLLRVLAGLHGLEAGTWAEGSASAREGKEGLGRVDLLASGASHTRARRQYRRSTVAWLSESPRSALHPLRTVSENWRAYDLGDDNTLLALLEPLDFGSGVEAIARRLPEELSGGEATRVQLAFARARDAPLLLCESPTAGLDGPTAARVCRLLREDHARGRTVVHVDHDERLLEALALRRLHLADATLQAPPPFDSAQQPRTMTGDLERRPVLTVSGLTLAYGAQRVLHSIDLTVCSGALTVLTGPSGSGKTTLGRAIARHLPAQGSLRVAASPERDLGEVGFATQPFGKTVPTVQYVFQDARASLNPALSVGRTLREHGARTREEATGLLRAVALPDDLLVRSVLSLSTGQMQRLALARALACRPRVLVCDEITSALDAATAAAIHATLLELCRSQRLAILYITHDLRIASAIGDELIVLDRGHVVEHGPTDEVMRAPRSAMARSLVEAHTQLYGGGGGGSSD